MLILRAVALMLLGMLPGAVLAAGEDTTFSVTEYRVLGNTVLEPIDIERTVYPFLGEGKKFADVEAARTALEATYHERGYGTVFVDIPEQDVGDGVVRLRVTEGRLHSVRIEGAKYFSEKKLLARMPEATPGAVPELLKLQQQVAAVNNESADRSVTPVLKAGPLPGTVDLSLKVDDHLPLTAFAELNNQYSVGTSHLRANAGIGYSDLFGALDDLQLQYTWTPQKPKEVNVIVASYTSRPFAGGLKMGLTYVHSGSDVPTVGALGVLGKGDIFSGRLTIPAAFTQETTQSVFVGADYKRFFENIRIDANTSLVTPIAYVNLSAGFSGIWRAPTRLWSLTASANAGARGVVNDPAAFENKRFRAPADYFYIREDAFVQQTLPAGFSLKLRLAGQYTLDPLITNENFAIAGADGVRGFLETEELGDSGVKAQVQLGSPAWQPLTWFGGRVFVFYDAGRAHVLEPVSDTQRIDVLLKSAGAGFELIGGPHLNGSLTYARALSNGAWSTVNKVEVPATYNGESRLLFTVRGSF
jgi:hemolysin activation/secretion protein